MSELYDEYYFNHGCGRPYERSQEWLQLFARIADHIQQKIQPRTAIDIGCAFGFLVEALRERGIEAYGIDISEFAISKVHEDVRPFCWVGSATDPLPQSYDLIICIEVLEHLEPLEAEQAVANICHHTEDVIFSSTPFDFKEETHFNVQEPHYWAEHFARHGFFRDLAFDASFVSQWAVRYRKARDPFPRVISLYEQKMWRKDQENRTLRELAVSQRKELAQNEQQIEELRSRIDKDQEIIRQLSAENNELHSQASESAQTIDRLTAEVDMMRSQASECAQTIERLAAERDELSSRLAEREKTISYLSEERDKLFRTRAWRAVTLAWKVTGTLRHARRKGIDILRNVYRRAVPLQLRLKFKRYRDRLRKMLFSASGESCEPERRGHFTPRPPGHCKTEEAAMPCSPMTGARVSAGASYQPLEGDERFPMISVVSAVYNKVPSLFEFLMALKQQSYRGDVEVILVDDCSSDESGNLIRHLQEILSDNTFQIVLVANDRNMGNCYTRNRGIHHATGDILIIVDADCIFNHVFIEEHVKAHRLGYDVCIGPMGIESEDNDIGQYLEALEQDPNLVKEKMRLQYAKVPTSFLNCVTRNFSITRSFLQKMKEPLFDEAFSYSKHNSSGFGWEDIEMGCRLYKYGARIWFAEKAISVHKTHPPVISDSKKPPMSIRNFAKLLEKHPEILQLCPEWALEAYSKIDRWLLKYGYTENADAKRVASLIVEILGRAPDREM